MKGITRFGFAIGMVALFLGIDSRANGAPTWRCFETKTFSVWSDADEDSASKLLVDLETFRSEMFRFTGLRPSVPYRVSVMLFASDEEFSPYKPAFEGETVASTAGVCVGSPISVLIALSAGQSKQVIFHEYVHALYRELGWETPLWFNEGTAELFSTFTVRKKVSLVGTAIPTHVTLLRRESLMPLSRLFLVTTNSADYNRGTPQGIYYAESWALVHMLACDRDRSWRDRLNQFLAALSAGASPDEDTFKRAFGIGFRQMEQKLDSYIYGGSYLIDRQPYDPALVEREIQVRDVSSDEIAARLAVVKLAVRQSPEAKLTLLQVPDSAPYAAQVQEALAANALTNGESQEAQERMLRAATLGTKNLATSWFLAKAITADWLTRDIDPTKRIGEEIAARQRLLLAKVTQGCPDNMEAWDAMARLEAFAPQPDAASVHAIEAVTRTANDPQVPQIKVLVAFAYHRLGDDDTATRIAEEVSRSPHTRKSTLGLLANLLPKSATTPSN